MTFEEQRRRYENDPLFHAYVEFLYSILMEGRITVGELRDAVTFAGFKFEMERVRPPFDPNNFFPGGIYGGRGFGKDFDCSDEERKGPDERRGSGRVAITERPLFGDQPHQCKDGGKTDET